MKNMHKLVSVILAVLISLPTLVEGTSVLTGVSKPDQIILLWLVYYNVGAALLSLAAAFALWKESHAGRVLSRLIFSGHFLVLLTLVFILFTSGNVALKSVMAMSMRSFIWALILFLNRKSGKCSHCK